MEELRILAPTAILGYGFPQASFEAGLAQSPHLIAVDAGSTDPGPYYLGAGISFTDEGGVKRDLRHLLKAAVSLEIPLIIGTAGGAGGRPHLEGTLEIIRDLAREEGLTFTMARIDAEFTLEFVKGEFEAGYIRPLEPAPELTLKDLEETVRIVGQMGEAPFQEALRQGAQVIVAGRAYDPAVFSAFPLMKGFDKGLAVHLGKILECAAIAATPGSGSDCMMGYLHKEDFEIEPLNPKRACTTVSVAAHTLYEKTNPYILPGPGGHLDLTESTFTQVNDRRVRVKGSRYVPNPVQTIKLEGVRRRGYRTCSIAGSRDPIFLRQLDEVLEGVRKTVADNFQGENYDYLMDFIVYGRDGVMGDYEPRKEITSHEVGIVVDVVSDTQAHADTICAFARSTMLHYGYTGRKATAGNLAFPFSPSDFHAGEVFTFSVYHLLETQDPLALFPIEIECIQGGGTQ